MSADPEAISWHEAAHGLASEQIAGWPVAGMVVDADNEFGGTYLDIPYEGVHELSGDELEAYLQVCAAGAAGEAYHYTSNGHGLEEALQLAQAGTCGDRADFNEAADYAGVDYDDWDQYVNDMYRWAADNQGTLAANVEELADNDYQLEGLPYSE